MSLTMHAEYCCRRGSCCHLAIIGSNILNSMSRGRKSAKTALMHEDECVYECVL